MDLTRTDGMARQASDLVKQAYERGYRDGLKAAREDEPSFGPAVVVVEMEGDVGPDQDAVDAFVRDVLARIKKKERGGKMIKLCSSEEENLFMLVNPDYIVAVEPYFEEVAGRPEFREQKGSVIHLARPIITENGKHIFSFVYNSTPEEVEAMIREDKGEGRDPRITILRSENWPENIMEGLGGQGGKCGR